VGNCCVEIKAPLIPAIEEGFPGGDVAFDEVVGVFGMMEVVAGRRQSGEPNEDRIRNLEGWILGQVENTL